MSTTRPDITDADEQHIQRAEQLLWRWGLGIGATWFVTGMVYVYGVGRWW